MTKPLTRQQQWRRANPRRYAAHLYVETLKRLGVLTPQPCEACGAKAEAHHPDYDRPGEIRWLCRRHHNQVHADQARACEIKAHPRTMSSPQLGEDL